MRRFVFALLVVGSAFHAAADAAAPATATESAAWKTVEAENFFLHYDSRLEESTPKYVERAVQALESARKNMQALFGMTATQPISVFLYREEDYRHAVEERFGFATIAFYDGAMHLRAPQSAGVELYALLQHEYFHAVFREQTGGDQPFWLNEGLANIFERNTLQQPALTQAESQELENAVHTERWISLARLGRNFVGLSEEEIRLAYLESTAAALWVQQRVSSERTPKFFAALAAARRRGATLDSGLRAALGVDTDEIDQALRDDFFVRLEAVSP